jgi:hypothetical protein
MHPLRALLLMVRLVRPLSSSLGGPCYRTLPVRVWGRRPVGQPADVRCGFVYAAHGIGDRGDYCFLFIRGGAGSAYWASNV